jgi:F0F1-type ATP synthase assembly protein I
MQPVASRSFPPIEAGALLAVVTGLGVGAGALVGWAAGSFGPGLIVGAVVGLPAGVFTVYRRYRGYFS